MKSSNTYGFSIIFLFFLITLVLSFGLIVLNKQNFFEKKIELVKINEVLLKNIITQGNISLNYNSLNNMSGGIYKPFLSCPGEVNYFSGSEIIEVTTTSFASGFCVGTLLGEELKLYHNATMSGFINGELGATGFTLIGSNSLSGEISSSGAVQFLTPSQINTDFVKARIEVNGIIFKNTLSNLIFWNHKDGRNIIENNTNNTSLLSKISQVSSGAIFLDVNAGINATVVEFDRNLYNKNGKLLKIYEFPFSTGSGAIGYIKNDATISAGLTNAKIFDFKNKDYAIFLSYENGLLDNMRYKLKIYNTETGNFSYINPIKDDESEIQYLGGSIVINKGEYYPKVYKMSDYKIENITNSYLNCVAAGVIPCMVE